MPSLKMPDVGESVTEGTVTRWLKQEGDSVAMDEPIVEIETEKVSVEVPSPFEGRLVKILVQEGEVAPVGAPLADFETKTSTAEAAAAPATNGAGAQQRKAAAPKRFERDQQGQPSATNETTEEAQLRPAQPETAQPAERTRRYSPVVLKLAAQHDIPLELVQGTGVEGRVTRQDVMRYLEKPVAHTVPPSSSSGVVGVSERQTPPPARPAPAKSTARSVEAPAPDGTSAAETTRAASPAGASASTGDDELRTLSATRKTIAKRLLDAHLTMPPAWMVVEADVTELVALREASKDAFRRTEGVGLTYLPFFVQAAVSALKQHPVINATFADDGITVHHRYHVGIAVAVESGLIVPVVRDADRKSIAGLAREIEELGRKARDRKLGIEDVRGATFTLDNTGAFGSVISQPLIPPGQAAILTTEAIRREVRVTEDGSFAARSVMNLCISFDHRALDGAQAGLFMRAVKQRIEAIRAEQEIY